MKPPVCTDWMRCTKQHDGWRHAETLTAVSLALDENARVHLTDRNGQNGGTITDIKFVNGDQQRAIITWTDTEDYARTFPLNNTSAGYLLIENTPPVTDAELAEVYASFGVEQ